MNKWDPDGNEVNDSFSTYEDYGHGGLLFVSLALLTVTAYVSQEKRISILVDDSFAKSQFKTYRSDKEIHHLVAKGARNADLAREILYSVGIGINNEKNLLLIKTGLHRRLHTDLYYGWANSVVISAYRNAGSDLTEQKEAVLHALAKIKSVVMALDLAAPY